MTKTRVKVALAGVLAGVALLAFSAGMLVAQTPPARAGGAPTHEQMHQMMDTVHGAGTSQRMHEAMGPNGEQLMDQCVGMMNMMQGMGGMMGGQNGRSMQDMMTQMMGGQ